MVHCQDGSNPPSPAPPLVLGTLLPHFISGKFSRLLAQTQGRISRRGVCVCSSLPPPPQPQHRAESLPGRCRGLWGAAGQLQEGCSSPGHFASCLCLAVAAPAPARVPSQHPHSVQGLTDLQNTQQLSIPCPSLFHYHPPRVESEGTSAGEWLVSSPSAPELSWSEARRAR